MVQDGAGGGGAVSHVAVGEGTDENFVDGSDENFPKGLVSAIVLIENDGGDVMGVAKVGDLGAWRYGWDGGIGAGVDWSNKGYGQECCAHGGGDSELQAVRVCRSPVLIGRMWSSSSILNELWRLFRSWGLQRLVRS